MISLILIFPITACLILFLIKNRALNNFMITLYALIHIICSICLCANYNPMDFKQNLFAVDELNKIFLIVLSIVYLAVAIYNNGYMKDDKSLTRKLRHYSYAVLLFVLSMTGAILSSNLGMIFENVVAQMLKTSGNALYFHEYKYTPKDTEKEKKYEIDFLLVKNKKVCPIEVKSSGYATHKSFDYFKEKYPIKLQERYIIYTKDLKFEDGITYIPAYMTGLL